MCLNDALCDREAEAIATRAITVCLPESRGIRRQLTTDATLSVSDNRSTRAVVTHG